ncbi:hypothetical protein MAR_012800 [Mya arenaria]|uniref:Integrase zinc-binding domain-containing protein n=1 Tax=Mya arenaria TaxID=6604 RepID=A0ABY7G276_MYAAR|nr:hypothetical protein MAR_012800 [Mya arenaria]
MIEMIWRKPVIKAPPRLQRMLLRLQRYLITIRYVTGKEMYADDTLGRAHLNDNISDETEIEEDMNIMIHSLLYWNIKDEIHIIDGMLFFNERIIIPIEMRREILMKLHESHLGISKTIARASESVYWPRMK